MESEDDMHDANDMESVDEDFYSDGDGYGGDALDSDGDDADYDFMGNESDDSNDQAVSRSQKNYTVLKEEDIRQRQEDDITTISDLLSLQREATYNTSRLS